MRKHPYPKNVVWVVASAIKEITKDSFWEVFHGHQEGLTVPQALETANEALQALWDVSRISSTQEAMDLADETVILDSQGQVYDASFLKDSIESGFTNGKFPIWIMYYGEDHDETNSSENTTPALPIPATSADTGDVPGFTSM